MEKHPSPDKPLTTGEMSRICNVAPRTVSKWFDRGDFNTGEVKGYRVPGSQDRRIPPEAALQFMKDCGMPLDAYRERLPGVLVVDRTADLANKLREMLHEAYYNVLSANEAFSAGMESQALPVHAAVLDDSLPADQLLITGQELRSRLGESLPLVASMEKPNATELPLIAHQLRALCNDIFEKPYDTALLAERLKSIMKERE